MTIAPYVLLYLLLGSSILHVFEEFVYPGGFYKEYNRLIQPIGLKASPVEMILINSLFLGGAVLVVILGMNSPVLALSYTALIMLNGLLHVIQTILKKRYFPGLYTALFLYIPLGVVSFISFPLSITQKVVSFLLGMGMHTVPFVIFGLKKLISKKSSSQQLL